MAQPKVKQMRQLVGQGKAMPAPGQDRPGKFNIRNESELDDAIQAVGRVAPGPGQTKEQAMAEVRRFILKRAKALGVFRPAFKTWNADGTLKS